MHCVVPSYMEKAWSLRPRRENLRLDWGTFHNSPQWTLGVRITWFRKTVVDAGWDLGRQNCVVSRGKEDWLAERIWGQIYTILEDSELLLRKDNGGHLYAVLETRGGFSLYWLQDSNMKGKILRIESVKCAIQVRLEGTTVKFWESRKIVELRNFVMQLPWRTVTMH